MKENIIKHYSPRSRVKSIIVSQTKTLALRDVKASDLELLTELFYKHQDLNLFYRCYSHIHALLEVRSRPNSYFGENDVLFVATQKHLGQERFLALSGFFSQRKQALAELIYIADCDNPKPALDQALTNKLIRQAQNRGFRGFYFRGKLNERLLREFEIKHTVRKTTLRDGREQVEILFSNKASFQKRGLCSWFKHLKKVS